MSQIKNEIKDKINSLASGEPGTTGREVFEDGTATDPNAQYSSTGTKNGTGLTNLHSVVGGEGHHHHQHEGHHSHSQHGDHHHSGLTGAAGAAGAGESGAASALEAGHHGHGHDGKYEGVGEHKSGQFGGIANVGNAGSESGVGGTGAGVRSGVGSGVGSGAGSGVSDEAAGAASRIGTGLDRNDRHAPARREGGEGTLDYEQDKVGALEQGHHKYERTGPGGPTTGGAPGTDRFDTSSGSRPGVGNTREGAPEDVNERAHNKGTGGIGGILGTTDKEFTGRDRTGPAGGAYGDETGHFRGNTSGPAGNTALTGREGTQENNPVAQAKSRAGEDPQDIHRAENPGVGSTAHPEHQKKGLMEKVKDALH